MGNTSGKNFIKIPGVGMGAMKQESVCVHVESANAYFVFYQTVPSSLKLREICLVYAYGHCYNPLQVLIM